jgi:hypothetical protein
MIRRHGLGAGGEPLAVAATIVILLVTASPWTLGFSGSHAAVAEHIAFAMGVGPITLLVSALPAAAVSIAVAGGWLVASPWVLGYASTSVGAWSADVLGGLALVALGAAALRARERWQSPDACARTEGGRP